MSKEIDFSKAPEGATHYTEESSATQPFMMLLNGEWYWYCIEKGSWKEYSDQRNEHIETAKPITQSDQWTIYNNTKPLKDLTDEQAAELFNAWRGGRELQAKLEDGFTRLLGGMVSTDTIYRIKPKSERELFVEACVSKIKSHNSDDPAYYNEWFAQLFEAGCRFKD